MVGTYLALIIWNTTCDEQYTYGNLRAAYFFSGLASGFGSYLLVFAVSYLETGLKMVFLQNDAYIWARYFVYFTYLPYLAFLLGYRFAFMTFPVFRPGDVTEQECKILFVMWVAALNNFSKINFGPLGWAVGAFNAQSTLMTVVGIGLISVANMRVSQTTKGVKTNWLQYALHISMLLALTASNALTFIKEDTHFLLYRLAANIIESLMGCLICYVVWAQASSTQFNFYDLTIVQEHDGRQRLICNRRGSSFNADLESSYTICDSSVDVEIVEEHVEDEGLY